MTSNSKIKGKRFTVKSNEAASKPPKMDHTSQELERERNFFYGQCQSKDTRGKGKKKKGKQGHWKLRNKPDHLEGIENLDLVSNKPDH